MAWLSDEEYFLREDTRDKKSTAASARRTRTHCGKGGRVKFPSDSLSKKEIEKMNGECKSYKMNEPMTWKEFKSMPEDLQRDYVKALRNKYGCTDKALAEMFNTYRTGVVKYFQYLGIANNGHVRKNWDKDGFYAWVNGIKVESKKEEEADIQEKEIQGLNDILKVHPAAVHNKETDIVTFYDVPHAESFICHMNYMLKLYGFVTMFDCLDKLGLNNKPEYAYFGWTNIDDVIVENEKITMPKINYRYTRKRQTIDKLVIPESGEMEFTGHVDDILRSIAAVLGNTHVKLEVEWTIVEE